MNSELLEMIKNTYLLKYRSAAQIRTEKATKPAPAEAIVVKWEFSTML